MKFIPDEGLRKEAGDKPVAETCIKKIKQCHIYVADFTIETKFTYLRHLLLNFFDAFSKQFHKNILLFTFLLQSVDICQEKNIFSSRLFIRAIV